MSWLFSQALVEEYSAGICSDGEPYAQLNVMPTPHKFWRNDKTIESSDHSRFGLTSRLLTEDHGAALLTSYQAVSRAKTLVPQGAAVALMGKEADYGRIWQGLFAKYSQMESLWRIPQCSLLGDSDEFLETWPRWGSMRSGESYLRPIPALPICESASGLWQTPVADDSVERTAGKWNSRGEPKLSAQVKLWPTPTARDWKSESCSQEVQAKLEAKPGGRTLAWTVRWPTPNATDATDATKWSNQTLQERQEKNQQIRLNTAVSPEGGKGGLLNPTWVEWLMGWPIGWTELKPLAMDKFHEWQQQHGGF